MEKHPTMKLGRNETCHCGSGKKYKKCCLKSDQAEQREVSKSKAKDPVITAFKESISKVFEQEDDSLPDPLQEQKDGFWTEFTGESNFASRFEIATTMLQEQPELCDGEIAFEVTTALYEMLKHNNKHEHFFDFLDLLEKQAPETWEKEKHFLLDYKAIAALLVGKLDVARAAFLHFSEYADRDLDIYYKMLSYFTWHNQDELIIEGLSKAKTAIKAEEDKFFGGTYEELCQKQVFYDLNHTISQLDKTQIAKTKSQDLPEIKAFLKRLATEDFFIHEEFTTMIEHMLYEKESTNNLEDYTINKELYLRQQEAEDEYTYTVWKDDEEIDLDQEDPAITHLSKLINNFKHYGHDEESIPITRLMSGTEHLGRILLTRGRGEYDDREVSRYRQSKSPSRKSKAKKLEESKFQVLIRTHPLLFNTQQFKGYMDRYGYRFLFTPYHELASFFEIIPVWLRFLNKRNFLEEDFNKDILIRLKPQIEEFAKICEGATQDNALHAKVQNWPN